MWFGSLSPAPGVSHASAGREGSNLEYPWLKFTSVRLVPIFSYSSVLRAEWTSSHSETILLSRVISRGCKWKIQLQCTLHLQAIMQGSGDEAELREVTQIMARHHWLPTSKVWIRDTGCLILGGSRTGAARPRHLPIPEQLWRNRIVSISETCVPFQSCSEVFTVPQLPIQSLKWWFTAWVIIKKANVQHS